MYRDAAANVGSIAGEACAIEKLVAQHMRQGRYFLAALKIQRWWM